MGYYVEFHFNADIWISRMSEVELRALDWMLRVKGSEAEGPLAYLEPPFPDHPLFQCNTRWPYWLHTYSMYHPVYPASCRDGGRLSIRTQVKNYNDIIEKFIDWITPFIDEEDGYFLGYFRYDTGGPVFIYKGDKMEWEESS